MVLHVKKPIFDVRNVILKPGIAILDFGIAIPDLDMLILIIRIAIHDFGITIPDLDMLILIIRIAILDTRIVIPQPGITIPNLRNWMQLSAKGMQRLKRRHPNSVRIRMSCAT